MATLNQLAPNSIAKNNQLFFQLLQLSTLSVFLGRAWQHLYWDAPFRTLLWDEKLMSPLVNFFTSMTWETYITSMEVNDQITLFIKIIGSFYLLCAIVTLFIKRLPTFFKYILLVGAISLIFLAFLYCKEKFSSVGQFFEYTLQFGSPLFLIWWVNRMEHSPTLPLDTRGYQKENSSSKELHPQNFILVIKIAIALTFTCHGLYALGYYPIPANFIEMTMNILGVGEESAKTLLMIAGIMDFVVSIGIFLPWKWSKYFLLYVILWGFGTTIARVWANFNWDWLDYVLLQWLHESVMRMPHFLIPLALYVFSKK